MNAAWAVHLCYEDDQHVLLHTAAYGRYLPVTDVSAPLGCRVEQRDYDELEEDAIRWQAVKTETWDDFLLRQAAGDRYAYLRWNDITTTSSASTTSTTSAVRTMMQWMVEPILTSERVPRLPCPNSVSSVRHARFRILLYFFERIGFLNVVNLHLYYY